MICKNCGKEIDEDSRFCEHCGERIYINNEEYFKAGVRQGSAKSKKKAKRLFRIVGIPLLIIALVNGYFIFVLYYCSDNYYGKADIAISNFTYNGDQFIQNVDYDTVSDNFLLFFSENNIDEVISDRFKITNVVYIIEESYFAYDTNTEQFTFEYIRPLASIGLDVSEDDIIKSNSIQITDSTSLEEGKIYHIGINLNLDINENYGSFFRRMLYKTIKNPYIDLYIYQRFYHSSIGFDEHISTDSYFIYEEGKMKPIFPNEDYYDYVNAIWIDTDLNEILYNEQGESYLNGPIRTRENIELGR